MPELQAPIIKGDSIKNAEYRDALPVNLTAVARPILGATGYLTSHSGLTTHSAGRGIDRGGVWNERLEEHFRLSGNKLITIDSEGVTTERGDILGSDRATMTAYSFNTQAIVANGEFWLYDGVSLVQVTDPDLGTPIDVCWVDSYYFFTDGETLFHTDITDESSIDPLKFATSEFSPDPTLGVAKSSDNQVLAFNRYTTEWFINRATDDFAFQRLGQKAVKCGIVGTHCKAEMEGRFYILGSGHDEAVSVHFLSPGSYMSIATREVDKIIAKYTDIELAGSVVESRIEDRDKFIIVRLPNETLIFNETISKALGVSAAWTIIESGVTNKTKWRGANGVFDPRVSSWIYGDSFDSRIGRLDNSIGGQYGEDVETIFYTPFLNLETMSIDQFELDTIPGFQVANEDITTAFSITYDGLVYNHEEWELYGSKANYGTRFINRRIGYVAHYIGFRVRTVSNAKLAFSGLRITYG